MSNERATTSGSSRRRRSPIEDLIKFFFCDKSFKRERLEYASICNADQILKDDDCKEMLRKFLSYGQGRTNFLSDAQKIVNCYELAEAIFNGEKELDEENSEELEEMCTTKEMEDKLEEAKAGERSIIDDFLQDLMRELAVRLYNEKKYQAFKEEINKKLYKK